MKLPWVLFALLVGCSGGLKNDPNCAAHEREFKDALANPRHPTLSVTGEWGHSRGGATCVYKTRGTHASGECGDLVPDGRGGTKYAISGRYDGVVDGARMILRSTDPRDRNEGVIVHEVAGNEMKVKFYGGCKIVTLTRQRIR